MSHELPVKWTGIMTFGKQLSASAFWSFNFKFAISNKPVEGFISTKSIFAPQYKAQLAEATKDIGEVQTISFWDIPRARQDKCRALVALLTATQ